MSKRLLKVNNLVAHVRWEQVGNGIPYGIILRTFCAIQRAGYYLLVILIHNIERKLSLANGTGQYPHDLFFHTSSPSVLCRIIRPAVWHVNTNYNLLPDGVYLLQLGCYNRKLEKQ